MNPELRIVTKIPLSEIWDETGLLLASRVRYLDLSDLKELLKQSSVYFVVADCGLPLRWIPKAETFTFWKEIRDRVAAPNTPIFLEHFPGNESYVASLWEGRESKYLVLLERHH